MVFAYFYCYGSTISKLSSVAFVTEMDSRTPNPSSNLSLTTLCLAAAIFWKAHSKVQSRFWAAWRSVLTRTVVGNSDAVAEKPFHSVIKYHCSIEMCASAGNQSSPGQTHSNALTLYYFMHTGTGHSGILLRNSRASFARSPHDTPWQTEHWRVHVSRCVCASAVVIAAAITVIVCCIALCVQPYWNVISPFVFRARAFFPDCITLLTAMSLFSFELQKWIVVSSVHNCEPNECERV